ncbi:hypothetical protein [Pelagibaculum spongiae]|uniref:Uncharacterized protein n=1 Tax=Pelagibaculum spongiae TaxID=2080658 RepID=A0A2V1H1B3_9GAMM|nr:hypothetical protein [Pelagibaculum spongiae]PVZ71750.1 hypothetical protein DC094_01610 [Pelagibaculum spongiae]
MKKILISASELWQGEDPRFPIVCRGGFGGKLAINRDQIRILHYGLPYFTGTVAYNGQRYALVKDDLNPEGNGFDSGEYHFISQDKKELKIDEDVLCSLSRSISFDIQYNDVIIAYDCYERIVKSVDLISGKVVAKKIKLGWKEQAGDYYCVIDRENKISLYNKELALQWCCTLREIEYIKPYSRFFSRLYKDALLVNLGSFDKKEALQQGLLEKSGLSASQRTSELVNFNLKDGHKNWTYFTQSEIEAWQLVDDRIYLATSYELQVLDASSGKVLVHKNFPWTDQLTEEFSAGLYVTESLVIYGHAEQRKLLILNSSDLSLIRDVTLPENWYPSSQFRAFNDQENSLLYIELTTDQVVDLTGAQLAIDLSDIQAPLEIEKTPEFKLEWIKSNLDESRQSLVITCDDPDYADDFDTVLRISDRLIRDQAYYHSSYCPMKGLRGQNDYCTADFDGQIRFNFFGNAFNTALVQQRMEMMEQLFANWVEKMSISSNNFPVGLTTNRKR